ncbi:MAG TPA: C-terminal binding protein [Dehalococcoidia bacterium]|nr:hydroxyacid dehydrogenase [Chloroflexota bacterium]MCH2514379.1 C-terminal binding protein [Dehalococcoidia bacterium]MQG29366.1 C-terminal binding protein [SAR202 cluster bacterium]MEE2842575.1 C-terminal binding protein [Chloroflexota bacterium]HAG55643.1 hydroxyacid dehydrogenase [Dehalococcoidia bacterium]
MSRTIPLVVHIDAKESPLELERNALAGIDCEIVSVAVASEGEIIEAVKNATVILNDHSPVNRAMVDQLENCKLIIRYGHGYDTVDVDACTEAGIIVTNIAGSTSEEVSNHALTLLLASARELKRLDLATTSGRWGEVYSRSILNHIYGETVGIVGFGWIGRAMARKCKALGMTVLVNDPYVGDHLAVEYQVDFVPKDELLERSDYVSLHVPHLDSTHHFIDSAALDLMKHTAYLVNTSRGPVVDEQALIAALKAGKIAGAGIDVYEQEPLSVDNPLLSMENVICTPHVAGSSEIGWEIIRRRAGEEAARVLLGRRPDVVVNPEVLGRMSLQS